MSDMLGIGAAATQASSSLPTALPSLGLTMEALGPTRFILVTEILQVPAESFFLFRDARVQETAKEPFGGPTMCVSTPALPTQPRPTGVSCTHCLEHWPKPSTAPLVFLTALILGILPFLRPGPRLPTTFSPFPLPAPLHTALLPPACQPPSLRRKEMGWGPHHPNSLVIPAHSQWGS